MSPAVTSEIESGAASYLRLVWYESAGEVAGFETGAFSPSPPSREEISCNGVCEVF